MALLDTLAYSNKEGVDEPYEDRPELVLEPNHEFTAWIGRRPGVAIARGGDSGAPVYLRTGTANATIIGSLFGGSNAVPGGYDTIWFTPRATVEIILGATVATGCCNNDSW